MNKNKVLILGGYGNFGKRIATALAKDGIAIIIAGRDEEKAKNLHSLLQEKYPNSNIEIAIFDAAKNLSSQLEKLAAAVVINTAGPFQNANYDIAKTCINHGINYIDLADGRDFVREISTLDDAAKKSGSLVISGASTVPALSSAVLEKYKNRFDKIDKMIFGVSPGQKASRGLATTKGILSYIGKPLKSHAGVDKTRYGWQDLYCITYPANLGNRLMANCDIPDLDLLPKRYNIGSIRFSAGMESFALHLGIWLTSWLVRLGLLINLEKHAKLLLKTSFLFDFLGTDAGGMHVILKGTKNGLKKEVRWFIIAKNGDGPQIPTIPAIILAKKIIRGQIAQSGALPCVAMVSLEEYLAELKEFAVSTYEEIY